ncbi:hypothetical protein K435DRAFT_811370 [Dendrothele bispora CBS 962.96]|uniref:Uncharacterized protein n=1 Tax=Dendrothele bispora (strain CBS 962.96) TaxID=1314807 RepID=A0A4S8KSM5_DENBC|nr:hypothetical protein K435DRAFT_811370 [Dendrothele bispora CBS 962.96]
MSKIPRNATPALLAPRFSQSSGECTTHGNIVECHSHSSNISPGFIVAIVIIGLLVIGSIVGTFIWCRINKKKKLARKNAFQNSLMTNPTMLPMTAPAQYSLSQPGAQYDPGAYHAATAYVPTTGQPYSTPVQTASSITIPLPPPSGGDQNDYHPSAFTGQEVKDPFGSSSSSYVSHSGSVPTISAPPSVPSMHQSRSG